MQAGQKVENLYEDFKDGSKLLLLLELLTNEKLVCNVIFVFVFIYVNNFDRVNVVDSPQSVIDPPHLYGSQT